MQQTEQATRGKQAYVSHMGKRPPRLTAMTGAPEQREAEELLQRADLARHRALRQCQLLRRACVAFMTGRGIKTGQGLQRGDFAAHGVLNIHNSWMTAGSFQRDSLGGGHAEGDL